MMAWLKALFAFFRRGKKESEPALQQFKEDLQELRLDEKKYTVRVEAYDEHKKVTGQRLDAAQAEGAAGHELDRLRHKHEEAKRDYQSYRRQVDNIRTNISTLANLIRMIEEKTRTGLAVEVQQYEAQARELFLAIQKQKQDLESISAADQALADVQDYVEADDETFSSDETSSSPEGPPESEGDSPPQKRKETE